ncbi:MAG TPA: ATP-binding protein [Thermoanaerobaculia bacterium]|nr:ATP-binding protein [Thermoanaerobaculia bacterium]
MSLLRPRRARTRIALVGAALSAILLFAVALGARTTIRELTFRDIDEELRTLAIAVGSQFEVEGMEPREALGKGLAANVFEFRLQNHSAILFQGDRMFALSGDLLRSLSSVSLTPYLAHTEEPYTAVEPYSGQRRLCRFLVLHLRGKATGGTLVLFRSIESSMRSLARLDRVLTALVLAGFLGTAAILTFVLDRALRPVEEVTSLARSVQASDLSRRVRVSTGGQEFQELTGVINSFLERLEHAFAAQQRLVADAAHELKTPIAVLLGETQDALRAESRPEERTKSLETIEATARGLAREVENLLSLARADAAMTTAFGVVDLAAVAAQSVEASRSIAAARGVRLELRHENGSRVRGDGSALFHLASNLVVNAATYTNPNTAVEVVAGTRDGEAFLEVRDRGPGVPTEHRHRIFDRFFRLEEARLLHPEGSGLGLAIADQVARTHGGRLEVEDRAGGGAVFRAVFPSVSQ